jgi:CheY-like chemotaxis protein
MTRATGLSMKPRLLLVDDDRLILGCFTAILEAVGFDVRAVASATEAAIALRQDEFDLVVTDMAMETPTAGYDVLRAAQDGPYQPEVVILTAFPLPKVEWQRRGAKALFLKGGQPPERLIEEIRTMLDDRWLLASRPHPPISTSHPRS